MKENNLLILNLNTYSHYSLLSSSLSIDQIIEFAKNNNKKYVALSDENLYGAMDFYLKAKKNNLMPVIGLSIKNQVDDFIVYAKNNNGYINLMKISSAILTNKQDFDITKNLSDVFIVNKKQTLSFKTDANVYSLNEIACNESRFKAIEDKKIYNALLKIKNNLTCSVDELSDGENLILLNQEQSLQIFNDNQIKNLNQEIANVDLTIEFEKNNIIEYKNNDNLSSKSYLHKLCIEGLNNKILNKEIDVKKKDIYIKRMDEELNVINQMGFNDYFLVVQDFINEAKNRNILVGPGRGSAAGSLVAYLLSITDVDSIEYNLLFERFLNPGRISMPDIDIDIMDSRRNEIIEYIFHKYGFDHVAHIITFQRIKAKMAIRDVGRILQKDLKEINKICKSISSQYEEDLLSGIKNDKNLQKYYLDYKDLFDISIGIIGCPRQTGIHAAGIVLSKKPLEEVVPIQCGVNGEVTTQYSMEFLEDIGLIKMDLLGLTNLTTIYNVLMLIKHIHKIQIDISKINLNDQSVFNDAQNGYTLGIFQLESPGMTSTLKKINPKCIEDISICSALFRPGPMQNIKTFVDRKNNKEKVEYIDNRNQDILKPTYGIIVYQEQVINLVKNIANFSPYEADNFRRIISKKIDSQLDSFKLKFYENAFKNGYTKKELDDIFTYIYTFADYGFNHSHSIAYSLISYWMLYLKHYYPVEFMTTLMISVEGNASKIATYINECKRLNIDVLKPNINLSEKSLSLYKRKILFGFSSVKGIGNETSKKIIKIRNLKQNKKFDDYVDAVKMLSNNGIGISIIETLIYGDCFDIFGLSKKYMLENLKEICEVSNMLNDDYSFKFEPRLKNVQETSEQEKQFYLNKEHELLGFNFSNENNNNNDLIKYKQIMEENDVKPLNAITNQNVFFDSIVSIKSFKITKTKKNTDMAFIKVIDLYNNVVETCSFTKDLISSLNEIDLSKKYLVTFKTSSFRLTFIKIKQTLE